MTEQEAMNTYGYMFEHRYTLPGEPIYPISFGFETGDGWHPLIIKLIEDIAANDPLQAVRITQIKEKFGILRAYFDYNFPEGSSPPEDYCDKIDKLVEDAEVLSSNTCEHCGGSPATQTTNGWITTLCERCMVKNENEKRIRG
jgi:hypothetical protein